MLVMKLLRNLFKKGFRIGWSTGKPFNPATQKRTDGIRDISEKKQKEADDVANR